MFKIATRYAQMHKTASNSNLYRDRATIFLHDGNGNILVSPQEAGKHKSPYYLPGGGVYKKESRKNPIPTNPIINRGLKNEGLEELGMKVKNIKSYGQDYHEQKMPKSWRKSSIRKRGFEMEGIRHHFRSADVGDINAKKYNIHGDGFFKRKPVWLPIEKVISDYRNHAQMENISKHNRKSMIAHADFLDSMHKNIGQIQDTLKNQNNAIVSRRNVVYNPNFFEEFHKRLGKVGKYI